MKYLILLASLLFVASCAHHRDVRPGVKGVHRVVVKSDNRDDGARNAIRQANHFCEKRDRSAAFVDENKKYTGDMSEADYKKAKTMAKIAQGAGSAAYVFGGKKESNLGGIVGLGGGIADTALGKGYTIEMRFKCI